MSKTSLISKYYALSKTKVRYISPNTRGIKEKIIASRRIMIFLMVIENMVMEDINMMEDGKILQRKLSKNID